MTREIGGHRERSLKRHGLICAGGGREFEELTVTVEDLQGRIVARIAKTLYIWRKG